MGLKERLMADLKLAMKDKDIIRKNTVQMIRSAILQYEKDNRTELDDDGIIDVIAKELKQRRDSLPDFEKSGREDLVANLKTEMAVLMEYLPEQLSEEAVSYTHLRPTAAAISPAYTVEISSRWFACICKIRPILSLLFFVELRT